MPVSHNRIQTIQPAPCNDTSWRRFLGWRQGRRDRSVPLSLERAPLRMELLVTCFRNGKLDPLQFGLGELLVITSWFLHQAAPEEALASLLESFRRLEYERTLQGGAPFSETQLTFWVMVVRRFMETEGSDGAWQKDAGRILRFYGRAHRLPYRYYSASRWRSEKARYQWLLPDMRSFPPSGRL